MFKYDIHVHTAEASPCGKLPAAEIVKLYKEAGYAGICITDHYNAKALDKTDAPWKEKADLLLSGYRAAVDAAGADFDVLLGIELRFTIDGNDIYDMSDYLVFGIDEELIYSYPELHHSTLPELRKFATEHNLLVIQAHPMRDRVQLVHLDLLDGIEVYNAHPGQISRNDKVEEFAENSGYDFILTSGSDCHEAHHAARGGIISKQRIRNQYELRDLLRSRDFELIYAD